MVFQVPPVLELHCYNLVGNPQSCHFGQQSPSTKSDRFSLFRSDLPLEEQQLNFDWTSIKHETYNPPASPGAIMISFFLERTRRNVRSFWGSMSRTVLRAFITSWWISPAYWTVLLLSRVVLMGIPVGKTTSGERKTRCDSELRLRSENGLKQTRQRLNNIRQDVSSPGIRTRS